MSGERVADLLVLLFVGGGEVQTLPAGFHAEQGFHEFALDGGKRHGESLNETMRCRLELCGQDGEGLLHDRLDGRGQEAA